MLRFAPSPTGDMHIGNLQVAIINYLVAQQRHDQFLVRIEDTDTTRNIQGKDSEIMMILEKFALKHDAVYHQSEHLRIHQTLAIRLLKEKRAFVCQCQEEPCLGHCEGLDQEEYQKLKASGDPFVIRLKNPTTPIEYDDLIQGKITADPQSLEELIILDREGNPSANFATACDDMLSNIDCVIQEEASLPNTPQQIHIKQALGYEIPTQYAHLPMIKQESMISVKSLFEQGFVPDAILNYLILLSHPDAPQQIFTLPEAIAWFEIQKISKVPQDFEIDTLRHINREHLKQMDDRTLSTLFGFADPEIGKLAKLYLSGSSTINELEANIRPIFKPKNFEGEWGESMRVMEKIIYHAPLFESFEAFETHIAQESGLEGDALHHPLRVLLTGATSGPELSEIYPFIKSYLLEVAS